LAKTQIKSIILFHARADGSRKPLRLDIMVFVQKQEKIPDISRKSASAHPLFPSNIFLDPTAHPVKTGTVINPLIYCFF
jgi:hypothetical protein